MTALPHQSLEEVFARFAEAVRRGDVEAFRALCAPDVPPQEALFLRNARKKLSLVFRSARIDAEVATVSFEVLGPGGEHLDVGEAVFTQEAGGWKLRGL
ncbi:MAG: hypothetical protein ACOZIN_17215 [Myxococcota bacterium]